MKRLFIFDFDGTIVRSPEKATETIKFFEQKTGKPFGKGFFGNINSLNHEVFEIPVIDYVKEFALSSINDNETYTVLLTGRMPIFEKHVKEILTKHNIHNMDEFHFNHTSNTLQFKLDILKDLKLRFPNISEVTMFEDREDHIPHFEQLGKELFENFNLIQVK